MAGIKAKQDRAGTKKTGVWAKDEAMESSEEEEVMAAKAMQKIKAKTTAAKTKAIKKK